MNSWCTDESQVPEVVELELITIDDVLSNWFREKTDALLKYDRRATEPMKYALHQRTAAEWLQNTNMRVHESVATTISAGAAPT